MTSHRSPNERPIMTTEPVAIAGALQALIASIIAALLLFDVVAWTPEQVGGVLAVYVPLVGVVTAVTRSRVTPVKP